MDIMPVQTIEGDIPIMNPDLGELPWGPWGTQWGKTSGSKGGLPSGGSDFIGDDDDVFDFSPPDHTIPLPPQGVVVPWYAWPTGGGGAGEKSSIDGWHEGFGDVINDDPPLRADWSLGGDTSPGPKGSDGLIIDGGVLSA